MFENLTDWAISIETSKIIRYEGRSETIIIQLEITKV